MPRKPRPPGRDSNPAESRVIAQLDELSLYQEIAPAIKAVIKYGGSVDGVLRKSQGLAAARLIELMSSEDEGVKLKASTTILDRVLGKSVERKINIYGELSDLNPSEIDNRIKKLLGEHNPGQIIDAVIEHAAEIKKNPTNESK